MDRKRKLNLPLIEVIIISLVLHVVVLLVLGGITIYTAMVPPRPELEAPPEPPLEEPQRMEQLVRMQQQQERSARPRQQISVTTPSQLNLPSLDITMPAVDTRVAVGTGGGMGSGMGRDFGRGGIDFSRSAVNFFGIRSQGERITFIVDTSRYMVVDEKGGIPAYQLIKDEIVRMVNELSAGTLFNVFFYSSTQVMAFAPQMLPATSENKQRFANWVVPINRDYNSIERITGNVDLQRKDIRPMHGDVRYWVKAVQIAMEQGTDNINMLVPAWQFHGVSLSGPELERWYRDRGWGEREEAAWQEAVVQAREWLNNENAARRSRGQPERVVVWIGEIVAEILPNVRRKSSPSYTPEEVIEYINQLGHFLYRDSDLTRPPIHVVLFLGKDEDARGHRSVENFNQLIRRNRGRSRVLQGLPALENVTESRASRR